MIEAHILADNPIQINPLGVLVAFIFLASIVGVLGWMLHLPGETESAQGAAQAVQSVSRQRRFLVTLLSANDVTDRIVALAAQIAQYRDGSIELLAVLEVPFMLPLDARVEEDEELALALLDRATAIVKRAPTKLTKRILKARQAGMAIVREAEEQAIDMILIANSPTRRRGGVSQLDPVVEYVLKNTPCEVLVLSSEQTPIHSQRTE